MIGTVVGSRDLDLNLAKGELVALISETDTRGDKRRWLVDAGGTNQCLTVKTVKMCIEKKYSYQNLYHKCNQVVHIGSLCADAEIMSRSVFCCVLRFERKLRFRCGSSVAVVLKLMKMAG